MLCQKCNAKQANVKMDVMLNEQHKQIHLCSSCYSEAYQSLGSGHFNFNHYFDDFFNSFQSSHLPNGEQHQNVKQMPPQQGGGNSFLDQHGRNLTREAKDGRIDAVIGRDKEIERTIEILNRRNKNNPVLIGEAGVGKTAIVEGFALKIVNGQVPAKLKNKEVYTLDINSLVAGTSYRGQFEEKMKELITELQQREDVILFIDELHMMVGAGSSAEGSMDAGNILKPALARGDMQIIGATTLKEYRMIEKDQALERRFQPVIVKEPTEEEAFEILKGIRPAYEVYHNVKYSDDVLKACVTLSKRYIQDRFLPDKAIDLLDEAGSKLNLSQVGPDTENLEKRLKEIDREKQIAAQQEQYEKAANLRKEELEIKERLENEQPNEQTTEVTVEHIQAIIESSTGIPVRKLQKDEQTKMKDLPNRLAHKVIGQAKAIEQVANAVMRARVGLKPKHRPTASFLFVGPTGTGKTELTKTLAEELFGSKDSMIRLDMSEYMEKHSVSKLIGSPPGYVGHDEAGQLTEQVRRNPYSIVLLDEIEKAHPDVMNVFLQIMEDGRLTDSQGRVVNFNETVIIMTSNAGVTDKKKPAIGFGSSKTVEETMVQLETLKNYFKPEFLNRIDSIIEFAHLTKEDLIKIVDIMLKELMATLNEQGIFIEVTKEAKERIAEVGYHPEFGARPLRRVIQDHIENKITALMIDKEKVDKINVSVEGNELKVK
ncbi:ATP-dependent Clp protease ATP-binding subunit [Alkalihalobacterium chitinilyticum]|uniref:ATP-dependent Clp protease ATP-binding subunit n=1 Tax=Alkalihalobacterium chitinilyticum TaxID=2980103 RepID=A0ABT5VM15_9BACI|nr:ATP-dependent Clp protease ATP-binding subunit [Alkalihalobacterium chitinilyticum]MDE5416327.1 ATP-dependent Clp protease ATP-binding subunit [Alkalihalobacterium chitinilyticum]